MKILVLTTYPADEPRHGGQHRVANILAHLRKAGHDVHLCGVLGSPQYPETKGFVEYPADALRKVTRDPALMGDWAIAKTFSENTVFFDKLREKISFKPDVIFCEQPWMMGFAHRYREKYLRNAEVRLIYGSANVEYLLKGEIVRGFFNEDYAQECARDVKQLELEAIASADLLVAVSQADRDWLADQTQAQVILAPNGVADRRASLEDVLKSSGISQGHKFALYCASSHPPNCEGFFSLFRNGMLMLSPDERLVLAGAIGTAIAGDSRYGTVPALQSRVTDAGMVEESVLRGLLATAHVIVLPLTQGGGTNLKTAEAIWSGQHVVATTKAMRGFEDFMSAPGIQIADDPGEFARALHRAMRLPQLRIAAEERTRRRAVLWDHTLSDLSKTLASFN